MIMVEFSNAICVKHVRDVGTDSDPMSGVIFRYKINVTSDWLHVESMFFVKPPAIITKFVFFGIVLSLNFPRSG